MGREMTGAFAQQPISFQYLYDEVGQHSKLIDSAGTVIEFVYDAAGNILEVKRSTVTGLAVFGFTPRQGTAGTRLYATGGYLRTVHRDSYTGLSFRSFAKLPARHMAAIMGSRPGNTAAAG